MNISKSKTRNINLKSFILSLFFLLSFSLFLSLVTSCEKGTEPEGLIPGRRDYIWTVDTLKTFNTNLMKMWGSSPTDVWAVGHGSTFDKTIWHYDGNDWSTDGISRGLEPWCIYGFSENDIWIGGSEGKIWHYNGNNWSENLWYQNPNYSSVYFMDIWGETIDDVYAVGFVDSSDVRFALMMHFNGIEWSRVNIEFIDEVFMKIRKSKFDNNCFIWSYISRTNPDSTKFFEFDRKEFKEIHYDVDGSHNWHDLTTINDEVIFTIGNGIYTYNRNKFNLIVENPYSTNYQSVYGRHKKDIIWMMSDGLTHYNGIDFEFILNFENKSLSDGVVFEKEVFFLANDFYNNDANNLIYHGVLQ